MTMSAAARKLSGLVKGSFRGVKVIRRGASPRVVAADVVGSRGTTRVTGSTLRARFGLYDTWGYFTAIATKKKPPAEQTPAQQPPQRAAGEGTGGVTPSARMTRFRAIALGGRHRHARPRRRAASRRAAKCQVRRRRRAVTQPACTGRPGRDGARSASAAARRPQPVASCRRGQRRSAREGGAPLIRG